MYVCTYANEEDVFIILLDSCLAEMTDCGSKHGEKQQDGPGFRLGIVPMVRQLSRQLSRQSSFLRPKAINERKDYGWILLGGVILCFNAGYVNGVTLSSLHAVASAHVTGLVALVRIWILLLRVASRTTALSLFTSTLGILIV